MTALRRSLAILLIALVIAAIAIPSGTGAPVAILLLFAFAVPATVALLAVPRPHEIPLSRLAAAPRSPRAPPPRRSRA